MGMHKGDRSWRRSLLASILVLFVGGGTAQAQERIGSHSQPLTTAPDVGTWTSRGSVVPVCWETQGYDREKAIVRNAVARTWEWWANINFTGWHACPIGGIGGSDTATADVGRVEYIAVHEFGHVLGFRHEQDAPGNEGPGRCDDTVDSSGNPRPITRYDRDSVMNYCNRDGNMSGHLTDIDIAGVQRTYGIRRRNEATLNPCASAPLRTMASLAAPWNHDGRATFAVYPSSGSRFLYWSQWNVRDGGWSDAIRWTSGDFDGDGRTDIGAIWNNNGANVLTVRRSTGTNFTTRHWLLNGGGWMESTVWLAGDFNGDGRDDIAGVWNDSGRVSIAVYLSNGTSFRLDPVGGSRWWLEQYDQVGDG